MINIVGEPWFWQGIFYVIVALVAAVIFQTLVGSTMTIFKIQRLRKTAQVSPCLTCSKTAQETSGAAWGTAPVNLPTAKAH